ncbi:pyridoxamine 5'-phosphate oxidase family protein [Nonomuraea recticatena]|uniref:pyridoxamine 5'-phosphate oxidase family protein n=1 Tax=Nonomuraea recticatena TaxID=46178 RepID=UPI00360796F7
MNQRASITMSDDDVSALLRESRKLQLATINPDGTPHLVTMFYALDSEGRVAFWTYGKAQKTRNLERDPRVSCLIETGDDYAELRGILLYGVAEQVERTLDIGMEIARRMTPECPTSCFASTWSTRGESESPSSWSPPKWCHGTTGGCHENQG